MDNKEYEVDVEEAGPGKYKLTHGTASYLIDIQNIRPGFYDLHWDYRNYTSVVGRIADTFHVFMQDTVHQIKLVSERQRFLNQSRNISQDGQKILTVSMPGRIVKVMAGVGQSVKRGDGVIIVEAMKMENEIRAPKDGVIQAIHVKAGDAVEAGEPLVTLQ